GDHRHLPRDGRVVAFARSTKGARQCHPGRRRYVLPSPDQGRYRTGGRACRPRAREEPDGHVINSRTALQHTSPLTNSACSADTNPQNDPPYPPPHAGECREGTRRKTTMPEAEQKKASYGRWYILGLICLMYLITYLDRVNISTAAPEI